MGYGTKESGTVLVIVDAQNDFITGPLGSEAAQEALKKMVEAAAAFDGRCVFLTRDTHTYNKYDPRSASTIEFQKVPPHCKPETAGWCVADVLQNEILRRFNQGANSGGMYYVDKSTFAADDKDTGLVASIMRHSSNPDTIYICGLVTDICVISNALMLRSAFPRARIVCIENACAGMTPETHEAALSVMGNCLIERAYMNGKGELMSTLNNKQETKK